MRRKNFYKKIVQKYLSLHIRSNILILGAGDLDLEIFREYKNVFFTNINTEEKNNKIVDKIIMQNLPYLDNSYDYVVTHASIHHSSRPHAAILEMLRVAKYGIILIESRDCLLTQLSCKLGLSEEYEYSAVKNKNYGGVDNTSVPNFVYRWTEKEIFKLINSYKPLNNYKVFFDYDYDFKFFKNFFLNIFFSIFFFIFKNQKNLMSVFILKNIKK